ncbi:MAG: ATP-dependent DNA helicase DinG [Cellvibrionaceae bacterium]
MLTDDLKKQIQTAYSTFLEGLELKPRYGQKLMVAAIARTLGNIDLNAAGERDAKDGSHICSVEAGTGTGKTVAYLLATLPIAKAMDKTVVISTATVALQEQIVFKDLPSVARHSGLKFSFTLAKGRGRYFCPVKLEQALADDGNTSEASIAMSDDDQPDPISSDVISIYQDMNEAWQDDQWDGDRDSWDTPLDSRDWRRLTTNHRQCTGRRCRYISNCPFYRAREDVDKVDCIVANHDLVLADLALGGGAVLPPPSETLYVFDEAHHLPDRALQHFSAHGRVSGSATSLRQWNKNLKNMLGQISGAGDIDRFGEQLPGEIEATRKQLDLTYHWMQENLSFEDSRNDRDSTRHRFENGEVPQAIKELALPLKQGFERLADLLAKMSKEVSSAMEDATCPVPRVDLENWFPVIGQWQSKAESDLELWQDYCEADDNGIPSARWVTLIQHPYIDFEVCSSPILAADTLQKYLWNRCCGAVLTSATLTALGEFNRLRQRAGTPTGGCYEVVPSPFDFTQAGTVRIPKSSVEGNQVKAHTDAIVDELPNILEDTGGSLVLFASRYQMETVYDGLPSEWKRKILVQGDRSKQKLLESHTIRVDKGEASVIFGLASFAEGIDLPGDYCKHVIIAKLPFAVPDDPVEAALAEWIEARGGNAFMEVAVPDTAVKLVQACGRLLRTEKDRGVITILDRRLVSKPYGKRMLATLPPFKQEILV